MSYWRVVLVLSVVFGLVNAAYLHRLPGLMGDEASEGENVYELLQRETITIQGERSYIGPAIDYVRVPFVATFGYTALALRVPMLLFSIATFFLAASVWRRLFGDTAALVLLAMTFFSPIYLTYQRLGWAITLFPFFALLVLWILLSKLPQRPLLAGLAAGLGLHAHIMFAPTIAGIAVAWIAYELIRQGERWKRLLAYWPAVVGFWAAFATQLVVLLLFTDDQGDPGAVADVVSDRVAALPQLIPVVVSGSSFVARYTGVEFSSLWQWVVTLTIAALAAVGVVLARRRLAAWLWLTGVAVHLGVLLVMIDRFTLRYFVMAVLGVWVLAGLGIGSIIERWGKGLPLWVTPGALVTLLTGAAVVLVGWPFLATGGSVADFSLGNRTNSAAALVDVRPLVACLEHAGPVTSENVHIFNRLQYLSHGNDALEVLKDTQLSAARFLVHYRTPDGDVIAPEAELCPELSHFVVEIQ